MPYRDEFTKDGEKFNTGDYRWAMVKPKMVERYKIIAENYVPHPAKINSAYRNPVRNKKAGGRPESRHIYGDAVDIQTVAIGHEGPPNKKDWQTLVDISKKTNPSYIERLEESKAGHVHVDWRYK